MEPGMDCQTCNDLLLDLAYGELDEVRAAAARKHVDACGECRDAFSRITRGRALARRLAPEEPPAISVTLRAAMEAQAARFAEAPAGATGAPVPDVSEDERISNVVPIGPRDGRVSRWFERVGELAMRRQVAMAAVFLLMIGVGLIFYQSHPRPTDAQDDRVPDVVPAVEVTASPGNTESTSANPARLPGQGPARPEHEERYRAYASPTPVAANARTDQNLQRERVQSALQAQQGRAGGSANAEQQAANGVGLDSLAGTEPSQAAPSSALAPMPSPPAAPMHAAVQQVAQTASTPSPSAGIARMAQAEAAPVANAAPARPGNELIVRLQGELASASDEASRARIRTQLIAAYESNAMYAEANALRAQSAEPAAAASNSLGNSAGAPSGTAQLQQNAGTLAGSNSAGVVDSAGSSSTRSVTAHGRSRRTTTVRRAAPARSAPSEPYMDSAY